MKLSVFAMSLAELCFGEGRPKSGRGLRKAVSIATISRIPPPIAIQTGPNGGDEVGPATGAHASCARAVVRRAAANCSVANVSTINATAIIIPRPIGSSSVQKTIKIATLATTDATLIPTIVMSAAREITGRAATTAIAAA